MLINNNYVHGIRSQYVQIQKQVNVIRYTCTPVKYLDSLVHYHTVLPAVGLLDSLCFCNAEIEMANICTASDVFPEIKSQDMTV